MLKSPNATSATRLLIVFVAIFSLVSLEAPLSSNALFPNVHLASACAGIGCGGCQTTNAQGVCSNFWTPAGPSMDTELVSIFTDANAEFTNIQSSSPTIDLTDSPLNAGIYPGFINDPRFIVTGSVSEHGYMEVEFNLANNFWGCNFNFGNAFCGVQIRQGLSHMIDKSSFVTNEATLSGLASAIDNPVPGANGGLLSPNPCAWDSSFPETGSNCVVGVPGGTAYHLGSAAGANGVAWLRAPGSADMNAAAQHFVIAGIATAFNPSTSVLTGISSAALSNPVSFFIRNDDTPRLDLGNSMAEQICYLFTGSYTIPCSYLSVTHGSSPFCGLQPYCCITVCGFNLSWGMYTAAFSDVYPFDSSLYFTYNSRFVYGISSVQTPAGPCSPQSVPSNSVSNYMWLCNSNYDNLSSQIENAPCISAVGDPGPGQINNGPGANCPGSSQLSAVSAGVQAEDTFGAGAYTIPVYDRNIAFGYLNNGWTSAVNADGLGLPNHFEWLNAWNQNPTVPGTLRQGFARTTGSVNPYTASSLWDFYIVSNIYDSLSIPNPLSSSGSISWMTVGAQQLSNSSLTYAAPAHTITTYRFILRGDMFFQDGKPVTAYDVAFTYLSMVGTGAFAGAGATPMTGVTILGPHQIDIGVNALGPFLLSSLTSLPIVPGRYWTNAGSSAWDSGINSCTSMGATCYPAQYSLSGGTTPSCALRCTSFPATLMSINLAQTSAGYDPIINHTLVGSGAWQCGTVTGSGSGVCTSTGGQNPQVGGSYTLTRFGRGFSPASSVSSNYSRSSGTLALYLWSQQTGDFSPHDFLNFAIVASCYGQPAQPLGSAGACAHYQQGIGANGATTAGGTDGCPTGSVCGIRVGLSQVAIVNRFVGLNWVAPYNWASSPPIGIVPLPPVLYENTITLNPSSVAGCTTAYPAGGYDC